MNVDQFQAIVFQTESIRIHIFLRSFKNYRIHFEFG